MTDDGHTIRLSPREYHALLTSLPLLFMGQLVTELPFNFWGGPRDVIVDLYHSVAANGQS